MSAPETVNQKFLSCSFILAESDIRKFDSEDNGPINNVMTGLSSHCYGTKLHEIPNGMMVDMYYINGINGLKGDIIELDINDSDYYGLLLRFCSMLATNYDEVDTVDAFNTFQSKLRGFMEKLGFFTLSTLEMEEFRGQDSVMLSNVKKGIFKIDFIDKLGYYRDYFGNINDESIVTGSEYVYLMINTDTSLFKIGTSKNPMYRERTLHSKEPTVHLIAKWKCGKEIEKQLHRKFNVRRRRGEWFRLSPADLIDLEKFMDSAILAYS